MSKHILLESDIERFKSSTGYSDILTFILILNTHIKSKTNDINFSLFDTTIKKSDPQEPMIHNFTSSLNSSSSLSQTHVLKEIKISEFNKLTTVILSNCENGIINQLGKWLHELMLLVLDIPPQSKIPGRFGNSSYKLWYKQLEIKSKIFLTDILKLEHNIVTELLRYIMDSFGNNTRIDYGTGHELHFIVFLMCLSKLDLLKIEDAYFIVFYVYNYYLKLVRLLQTNYTMEPAGSRGVWGLDDFQFLPFLWGSSQLTGSQIPLNAITSLDTLKSFRGKYLYFDAVYYIYLSKGPRVAEHSPILFNIISLADWSKVNNGLIKMFQGQVLQKFVVVQHLLFGKFLSLEKKFIAPTTQQPEKVKDEVKE